MTGAIIAGLWSVFIAFVVYIIAYKIGAKETRQHLLDVMYEHEKSETQADRLDILRAAIRYVEELVWQNRR